MIRAYPSLLTIVVLLGLMFLVSGCCTIITSSPSSTNSPARHVPTAAEIVQGRVDNFITNLIGMWVIGALVTLAGICYGYFTRKPFTYWLILLPLTALMVFLSTKVVIIDNVEIANFIAFLMYFAWCSPVIAAWLLTKRSGS